MKRLVKREKGSVIDGVCAGIGEYFGVDPVLVRLIFLAAAFAGGAGIVAYIIAMIVMPEEDDLKPGEPGPVSASRDGAGCDGGTRIDVMPNGAAQSGAAAGGPAQDAGPGRGGEERAADGRGRRIVGLALAAIGVILLLRNLGVLDKLMRWWPLALIAAGVVLFFRPGGSDRELFNSGGQRKC